MALIVSSLPNDDYKNVKEVSNFVLKIGALTGVCLVTILGVYFGSLATLFTRDAKMFAIVRTGILFVSATQPLNALAYIFYALHYGVSDFSYAASSMMLCTNSSLFLLYAPSALGLHGVWLGLTLFYGISYSGWICQKIGMGNFSCVFKVLRELIAAFMLLNIVQDSCIMTWKCHFSPPFFPHAHTQKDMSAYARYGMSLSLRVPNLALIKK